MHRVFNCGIGLVVVVDAAQANQAAALLEAAGEKVWTIGEVVERGAGQPAAVVV
jgi:phosphoribosylformylglycinamidine cyclo-ligase